MPSEGVTDHPTRARLLNIIEEYPGLHVSELARRTGVSVKLAEYHLQVLESNALVSSAVERQARHYFGKRVAGPVETVAVGAEAQRMLPHLRHPVRLRVAAVLASRPGCRNHEVAAAIGLSRPATSYHLARLTRAGIAETDPGGGYRLLRRDIVLDMLRRHRPTQDQVDRLKGLLDDLW